MRYSCEPEELEHYKALEERLWNVQHPNDPMPGTEEAFGGDDEIIMERSGRDISKNPKCPITGLEVRLALTYAVGSRITAHLFVMTPFAQVAHWNWTSWHCKLQHTIPEAGLFSSDVLCR